MYRGQMYHDRYGYVVGVLITANTGTPGVSRAVMEDGLRNPLLAEGITKVDLSFARNDEQAITIVSREKNSINARIALNYA